MALLVFPPNPANGQLYPVNPVVNQYQYQWEQSTTTWRLLGAATGVTPGTYCAENTKAARFTVDAVGRITFAECVELDGFVKTNNISAYNGYQWPNADGGPGQVLVTDGSGGLSWLTITSGGSLGSVSFVGTGTGLSGGPITGVGTINLNPATTTTLGGVIPDGTTITVSPSGAISAAASPVGLGLVVDTGYVKLSIPASFSSPTMGSAPNEAVDGSLYYDGSVGALFYRYNDGVSSQWVQVG